MQIKKLNSYLVNIPFAPGRWPFFYGWVIMAATTIGVIASIPGQTMGVGVFTDDLIITLGLSSVQLSSAYMFGTIMSSLLLPYAGRILDSIGARLMVVISSAGLGLSMVALSQSDRLAAALSFFPGARGKLFTTMLVISVCFLLIRFFGQGCLTLVSRVSIGKWFNHRRGLAAAISGIFVTFGFNGSPLFLNHLVESSGWRWTAIILAGIVGLGMSLLGWLFYRDTPEECGLVMDGITDESRLKKISAKVVETTKEFTRREAVRTRAFWVFSLGVSSQSLIITAIVFHISSIGVNAGLSRTESFAVFLPMSLYGISANFISGWLSDRIRLKWLLLAMMISQAIGTTGLMNFGEPIGRFMFTAGHGITGGIFATLLTVAFPRFFGREHLGAISGLTMSIMVFASAIGPVLFSLSQDLTGNYLLIEFICLLMPITIIIFGIKTNNPQEKQVR
jgi:MFS transporter, OFA family, oxalate/formate antiporter